MSDEQLDRLVRDADPYRRDVAAHLDRAEHALLEEIMSEPVRKAPRRRGLATAVAAAAAVTGLLVTSAVIRDRPESGQAAPVVSRPAPATLEFAAAVRQAAENNPRLLINQPGWKVTHVYGFAEKDGGIAFEESGGRQLDMNWYPADQYDGYYKDRLRVSPPEATKVDGWKGARFTYSESDFAIMLGPRDGVFAELRTGGGAWTLTSLDKVVADIKRVDVDTWLMALPPEIVTPGKEDEAAKKILADVPVPPGFDVAALKGFGANDPYQFGAKVTGRVACGWIAEWKRAKRAGDDAAQRKATDALRGSHQWKILNDMNDDGDYPELLWEYADRTAAGSPPSEEEVDQGLGCS
jgi:hypothetical protein